MSGRYKVTLDAVVRGVLERSTITATSVKLPEMLHRDLYVSVDRVLRTAGGKWNRSARVHIFEHDPREVLGLAMQEGEIVNTAKVLQQFFTPVETAEYIVDRAEILPTHRVLEPSAGSGQLADVLSRSGARVECVEIDQKLVDQLRDKGYTTRSMNFLHLSPWDTGAFHRVVMNPPFTKEQDIAHITHALQFLAPGGLLVAVAGAGVKTSNTRRGKTFRALVAAHDGRIMAMPGGSFSEAGTNVNTVLIVMRKL